MICIPGNHDVPWWKAPFGSVIRRHVRELSRYISEDLEPVLHVPGATSWG